MELCCIPPSSHAAGGKASSLDDMKRFTKALRQALHNTFRYGQGTRDMAGPEGLTTEAFIEKVAWRLGRYVAQYEEDVSDDLKDKILTPSRKHRRNYDVDRNALKELGLLRPGQERRHLPRRARGDACGNECGSPQGSQQEKQRLQGQGPKGVRRIHRPTYGFAL